VHIGVYVAHYYPFLKNKLGKTPHTQFSTNPHSSHSDICPSCDIFSRIFIYKQAIYTIFNAMSALECASCAIKQHDQDFYEFDFETGPHRVCSSCFQSDSLHVFDDAVRTQHMANTAQAQSIASKITALDVDISTLKNQLAAITATQQNQRVLLAEIKPDPLHSSDPAVVAQYHQNAATALHMEERIKETDVLIHKISYEITAASRTQRNQRCLLAAIHPILQQGLALQSQVHYQNLRHSIKNTAPDDVRLLLPRANRNYEAFLMTIHPRLGRQTPSYALTTELGDMICQYLGLPRTSLDREKFNCNAIYAVLNNVRNLQPQQARDAMFRELEKQTTRQKLTLQQVSAALSNTLQLQHTNIRETFQYIATLHLFVKNPLGTFKLTDRSEPRPYNLSHKITIRDFFETFVDSPVFTFQIGLTTITATDADGVPSVFPVCMITFNTKADDFYNDGATDIHQDCPDIEHHTSDDGTIVPRCMSDFQPECERYNDNCDGEFEYTKHSSTFFIYNLGHKDLVLAAGTVQASFGMHEGDLVSYCAQNPEYSHLFDGATIPAKGIGNIGTVNFVPDEYYVQRNVVDANDNIVMMLAVSLDEP